MDYKKKLKLFVFGLQSIVLVSVCGVTYLTNQLNEEILSKEEFIENTKIKAVKEDAILTVNEKAGFYSFSTAKVDDRLFDFSEYSSFTLDPSMVKNNTVQGTIEGFSVTLPFNVLWQKSESFGELMLSTKSFDENSTVLFDQAIHINGTDIKLVKNNNPKTKEEIYEKTYATYKVKAQENIENKQEKQLSLTVMTGVLTLAVYIVFYFIMFRRIFKSIPLYDNINNKNKISGLNFVGEDSSYGDK